MHQKEVLIVLLKTQLVDHAGGHGECGNACGTDHGIDLLLGEEIHQLCDHNAAEGVEDEGKQTQPHDQQGFPLQEFRRRHAGGNSDSQEDGDQVCQHLLRGFGQRVQNAAFTDQVTEHQKSDQSHGVGGNDAHDDGDDDGEEDAGGLGNGLAVILHADQALLAGGADLDDGGLDDGNQRHIGVRRNHDRRRVVGVQHVGNEDGGGTVRRADDGNGRRIVQLEAQEGGKAQGEENTELRRRTEDHIFGIS